MNSREHTQNDLWAARIRLKFVDYTGRHTVRGGFPAIHRTCVSSLSGTR